MMQARDPLYQCLDRWPRATLWTVGIVMTTAASIALWMLVTAAL
jgi:hypothetical protein